MRTRGIFTLAIICLSVHLHGSDKDNRPAIYLKNDVLEVGCDLSRGGAVFYLSPADTSYNLVNIYDEGRYIQQSYYAGHQVNRRNNGQSKNWSPWSWNPVQAGDAGKNSSRVLEYKQGTDTLYIKCRPLLWDMTNADTAECFMEQWIWLNDNVVHLTCRITIFRTDNIWGVDRNDQEVPAVYMIADLNRLVTYKGSRPWTNDTLTVMDNRDNFRQYLEKGTWPWNRWVSSENWAACINENNWGLGVFPSGNEAFSGGYNSSEEHISGTAKSDITGFIGPLAKAILEKNDTYTYNCELMVGQLKEIRDYAYYKQSIQARNP